MFFFDFTIMKTIISIMAKLNFRDNWLKWTLRFFATRTVTQFLAFIWIRKEDEWKLNWKNISFRLKNSYFESSKFSIKNFKLDNLFVIFLILVIPSYIYLFIIIFKRCVNGLSENNNNNTWMLILVFIFIFYVIIYF